MEDFDFVIESGNGAPQVSFNALMKDEKNVSYIANRLSDMRYVQPFIQRNSPMYETVAKAIDTGDFGADTGLVPQVQPTQFVLGALDKTDLLKPGVVDIMPMAAPTVNVPRLDSGGFALRAVAESGSIVADNEYTTSPSNLKITVDKYMAKLGVSYEVVEDVIPGVGSLGASYHQNWNPSETGAFSIGVLSSIGTEMMTEIGNNLEDIALNSRGSGFTDTNANRQSSLAQSEGWVKILDDSTDASSLDLSGDSVGIATHQKIIRNLPERFKTSAGSREIDLIAHPDNIRDFIFALSARGTGLGDDYLSAPYWTRPRISGVRYIPCFHMDRTKVIVGSASNLMFGIFRNILLQSEQDMNTQQYLFYVSMRVGMQVRNQKDMLICTNITPVT